MFTEQIVLFFCHPAGGMCLVLLEDYVKFVGTFQMMFFFIFHGTNLSTLNATHMKQKQPKLPEKP